MEVNNGGRIAEGVVNVLERLDAIARSVTVVGQVLEHPQDSHRRLDLRLAHQLLRAAQQRQVLIHQVPHELHLGGVLVQRLDVGEERRHALAQKGLDVRAERLLEALARQKVLPAHTVFTPLHFPIQSPSATSLR